jgi:Fatty acid cis/trans isomerase (CTI)
VLKGLVGEPPETAWLIDYPILERVHYLLVAGFDVYGTASHQAMTRLYMDFLRMEAEMNFLAFLPQSRRKAEIAHWYRGAQQDVQDYLDAYFSHEVLPPPYDYRTQQPKLELFQALHTRLDKVLDRRHDLSQSGLPAAVIAELKQLDQVRGIAASIVPQTMYIQVEGYGLLTLLSNSAYTNIASMFNEADRRLPLEDSLTLLNGVVGAYPNVFLQVAPAEISTLVASIQQLRTEGDYAHLLDRFGMRRTDARFWSVSDEVHDAYRRSEPLGFGVLDYSRYDNR